MARAAQEETFRRNDAAVALESAEQPRGSDS
jgi:hypothetical protein